MKAIDNSIEISYEELELFQTVVYEEIGIILKISAKKQIQNKLLKRLSIHKLDSFKDYYNLILKDINEKLIMINIITTNETYFFREHKQFTFLVDEILPMFSDEKVRIWSAASSVGAEAFTLGLLLSNNNIDYKIVASDINSEVIETAKKATYPIEWLDKIPKELQKECFIDGNEFIVSNNISKNISFEIRNLIKAHSNLGMFDIIFLRNVLIYFNAEIKAMIIQNIIQNLRVGGFLFISVTEYLDPVSTKNLKQIDSSIFQKISL